jgi:hypothetical protein
MISIEQVLLESFEPSFSKFVVIDVQSRKMKSSFNQSTIVSKSYQIK